MACENLTLDPADTIVFEDAPKGVDAAKAGGMVSVRLGSPENLGHADLVLGGLGDVSLNDILNKRGVLQSDLDVN